MTRKALARRIAEVLFNEPATRRGAGAAPTRRAARILAGCFVARRSKTTAGILPPRAAHPAKFAAMLLSRLRLGAPVASPVYICTFSGPVAPDRAGARPYQSQRHRLIKPPKLGLLLRDALQLTCPCPWRSV